VLLEWGSHSAFSRLALITVNFEEKKTTQATRRGILFQQHFFNCCTHFTRNDTLPLFRHFALEADNFYIYIDFSAMKRKFLF